MSAITLRIFNAWCHAKLLSITNVTKNDEIPIRALVAIRRKALRQKAWYKVLSNIERSIVNNVVILQLCITNLNNTALNIIRNGPILKMGSSGCVRIIQLESKI